MTIQALIERVHENAKAKGFWDIHEATTIPAKIPLDLKVDIQYAIVAQKLALVSTEIAEFEAEAVERNRKAMLEELADVVIRVFDLCGYLETTLPEDVLATRSHMYSTGWGVAAALYREVALAVQSHRKGRHDFELHIEKTVRFAQDFVCGNYANTYALRRAVEEKMQKNESREHRHGAAY